MAKVKKLKSVRQSEPTPKQAFDQAIVLLLQSAQMIEDILAAPKLAYKGGMKQQVAKIHARAKYLSKFMKR